MSVSGQILAEFSQLGYNGFLICSKGLGLIRLLYDFIQQYSSYDSLTLIVDLRKDDCKYFQSKFQKDFPFSFISHIADPNIPEKRAKDYLKGGVIFTTSQIVILDLLCDGLSSNLVDNVIVFGAERLLGGSGSFFLRFLSENPKKIKRLIITEKPDVFEPHATKLLNEILGPKLLIWPHFRKEVQKSLQSQDSPYEFLDSECQFEPHCQSLQLKLVFLRDKALKALGDKLPPRHVIPFLSPERSQLTYDYLKIESLLFKLCEQSDLHVFVGIHELLSSLSLSFKETVKGVNKVLLELPKDHSFKVFEMIQVQDEKDSDFDMPEPKEVKNTKLKVNYRYSIKFSALLKIFKSLDDMAVEMNRNQLKVLIVTNSDAKKRALEMNMIGHFCDPNFFGLIATQMIQKLSENSSFTSTKVFGNKDASFQILIAHIMKIYNFLSKKYGQKIFRVEVENEEVPDDNFPEEESIDSDDEDQLKHKGDKKSEIKNEPEEQVRQIKRINYDPSQELNIIDFAQKRIELFVEGAKLDWKNLNEVDLSIFDRVSPTSFTKYPHLSIETFSLEGIKTFEKKYDIFKSFRPDVVIFSDIDLELQREISRIEEIYPWKENTENPLTQPKIITSIFILNSIQTHRYADNLKKETSSEERIIKNLTSYVVSKQTYAELKNSAKNGLILVDKREFASRLPFSLYQQSFKIIPVFLHIADYILSDEIGLERKDVATGDFANSLRSGRLAKQLRSLCSTFKKPILLLENYTDSPNFGEKQIYQLMTAHKNLTVFWSNSERQTSLIFEILKRKTKDPTISLYSNKQVK